MTLIEIEAAIIAQLKSKITGITIEGMPDIRLLDTIASKYPNGAIFAIYTGSKYGKSSTVNVVNQDRNSNITICIYSKSLKAIGNINSGIYELMEKVLGALTGFKMDGCGQFEVVEDKPIDAGESLWRYDVTFSFSQFHKQVI